jgi:hypothetical protein
MLTQEEVWPGYQTSHMCFKLFKFFAVGLSANQEKNMARLSNQAICALSYFKFIAVGFNRRIKVKR